MTDAVSQNCGTDAGPRNRGTDDADIDAVIRRRCRDDIADAVVPAALFEQVLDIIDTLQDSLGALSEAVAALPEAEVPDASRIAETAFQRSPTGQAAGKKSPIGDFSSPELQTRRGSIAQDKWRSNAQATHPQDPSQAVLGASAQPLRKADCPAPYGNSLMPPARPLRHRRSAVAVQVVANVAPFSDLHSSSTRHLCGGRYASIGFPQVTAALLYSPKNMSGTSSRSLARHRCRSLVLLHSRFPA